MSLTSPLGLMRHVRQPDLRLEVVPWLNVLVVAWLLSLLQSNYILAPGLSYALDPHDPAPFTLPTAATPDKDTPKGRRVDVRLSLQASNARLADQLFYLDSGIYHYGELAQALANHARQVKKPPGELPVLLLVAPAKMDLDTLTLLSNLAHAAGFGIVQIAEQLPPGPADQAGATAP